METLINSIGERFKYWLFKIAKVESAAEFSREIQEKEKNITNILNGTVKKIQKETLEKILKVYPKFPSEWIKTGEGNEPEPETALKVVNNDDDKCQKYKSVIAQRDTEISGLKMLLQAKNDEISTHKNTISGLLESIKTLSRNEGTIN